MAAHATVHVARCATDCNTSWSDDPTKKSTHPRQASRCLRSPFNLFLASALTRAILLSASSSAGFKRDMFVLLLLPCYGAQGLDPQPRRRAAAVTCTCTNYGVVNTGLSSATGLVQYCSDCDCSMWGDCTATTSFPTTYPTRFPTNTLAPTMGAVIAKPTYEKPPPVEGCETSVDWEDPWSYNCQYYSTDHNEQGEIWTAEMEKMMSTAATPIYNRVAAWCKETYITHKQYGGSRHHLAAPPHCRASHA